MSVDVVGNLATSIRNASALKKRWVDVRSSSFIEKILSVLKMAGYIKDFSAIDTGTIEKKFRVVLKYGKDREPVIHEISRVSRPGHRMYTGKDTIRPVCGGFGVSVISTSRGVFSNIHCKRIGLGGEVLLRVW